MQTCDGCGRILRPGEIQYEYAGGNALCGFCDARIQIGFIPPEPFEYPRCPICDNEMWCSMGIWYCYNQAHRPTESEIAPLYAGEE